MQEKRALAVSGWPVVGLVAIIGVACIAGFAVSVTSEVIAGWIVSAVGVAIGALIAAGLFIVNPNEAKVVQLFGKYAGTAKQPGLWWMNPFAYPKLKVSQRVRNFESGRLKVNDRDGNPVEIASVVVWKVDDTADAVFQVDDYENFVQVQSEAALRNMATTYPYDTDVDSELALRRSNVENTDKLRSEIQDRLTKAGIDVIEARISHIAYAAEIAGAMLRRQQAGAVVAARTQIVEGAVGMVEMALEALTKKEVVQLDEERKATMVSNLMVVLCGDREAQPVVNTGTLYQ
ncbi:MAG: SPFH domain-containing protein [SAR202 cluster bacterium]|nr:SPFH domain-containing protein [SAR202 cluster bacterium]